MSCLYLPLFIVAAAIVAWAVREAQREPGRFGSRLPTLFGALMALGSFIFLPWIKVSPTRYIFEAAPEILREILPGALTNLLKAFGARIPGGMFEFLNTLIGIPGVALVFVLPSLDLFVRFVLILVPLVAAISLLWFVVNIFVPPTAFGRVMGILQTFFAFLAALLLLLQLPTLDTLTYEQNLTARLVTVLLGVHLGAGIWAAWVGLLLIGSGGVIEAAAQSVSSATSRHEMGPSAGVGITEF